MVIRRVLPAAVGIIAVLAVVMLGGCNIMQAYEEASKTEAEVDGGNAAGTKAAPRSPSPSIPSVPVRRHRRVSPQPTQRSDFLPKLQQKTNEKLEGNYRLDEKYKLYHRKNCPHAPKHGTRQELRLHGSRLKHVTARDTTVTNMSEKEIEAKGYEPCKHCRPEFDEAPPWYQRPEEVKRFPPEQSTSSEPGPRQQSQ